MAEHKVSPPLHRAGFSWMPIVFWLCCWISVGVFLSNMGNEVALLRVENAMLKERLVPNEGVETFRAAADSLKKQVAALEIKVNENAASITDNVQIIGNNTAGIGSNTANITSNAAGIVSIAGTAKANANRIASNAGMIQANAKDIANQTAALANVSAAILQVLGDDVEAAVALEVPIVVARSLGNITAALEGIQKLVAQKASSAELVFERVNFSFPASAKPDSGGRTPLEQCATQPEPGGTSELVNCCLIGGGSLGLDVNTEGPCGSYEAQETPVCPSFCNATITCPMGSFPVSTECAGYNIPSAGSITYDPKVVYQSNVTQLANGQRQVSCTHQNGLYLANIAQMGNASGMNVDSFQGVEFDRRMTTFCVSVKTSTAPAPPPGPPS
eukprot:gene8935-1857_t